MAGEQVLTESDDDRGGGTVVDTSGVPPGIAQTRDGGTRQQQTRQPEEDFEVILDDGEGGGGEAGGEGRVTTEEVGARPVLDQQRRAQGGQVKTYSREEIDAMSPEQRRRAWRDLSRDEQRANRPLDRARRKDNAHLGKRENDELKGIVSQQATELAELRQRVNGFAPKFGEFEKGQVQSRLQNVNSQLSELERQSQDAKHRMAEAMDGQDRPALMKAMEDRDTLFVQRLRLQTAKQQLEQQLNATPAAGGDQGGDRRAATGDQPQRRQEQQPQQRQKSREEQENIRDFREEFPQFNNEDPDDEDSQLVIHLDAQVAKRFNPATPEYWEELRDKIEEHLPHWFDRPARGRQNGGRQQTNGQRQANGQRQQANGQQVRRGPATGAGGEATPGQQGQRTQVKLNKQRVDALILANVIDRDGKTVIDKPKFRRMLAKFSEFDREQSGVLTA